MTGAIVYITEYYTATGKRPVVSIAQPATEVEVRAGQSVVVEGAASDDIGLSAVDLVVSRPATGVERRPIAIGESAGRSVAVREKIEVDALQLRPGESAVVHLEAADTNPLDGNRHTESPKVRIRMFSPERFHAHNLDELAKLTELWTLRLADRLERDPTVLGLAVGPALKNRTALADEEQRALEVLRNLRLQWEFRRNRAPDVPRPLCLPHGNPAESSGRSA